MSDREPSGESQLTKIEAWLRGRKGRKKRRLIGGHVDLRGGRLRLNAVGVIAGLKGRPFLYKGGSAFSMRDDR
jgi:hypothetical protein